MNTRRRLDSSPVPGSPSCPGRRPALEAPKARAQRDGHIAAVQRHEDFELKTKDGRRPASKSMTRRSSRGNEVPSLSRLNPFPRVVVSARTEAPSDRTPSRWRCRKTPPRRSPPRASLTSAPPRSPSHGSSVSFSSPPRSSACARAAPCVRVPRTRRADTRGGLARVLCVAVPFRPISTSDQPRAPDPRHADRGEGHFAYPR